MNFTKKLVKVKHFLGSKIYEDQYLKETESFNNPTLKAVIQTIEQIKNSSFEEDDLSVFDSISSYRKHLSQSEESINYSVFGLPNRIVKEIYTTASSPEIWGRFHYLLAKNLKAKKYLEIGTNLGISGSYILNALKKHPDSFFISMEGVPKLCELSANQFQTIVDFDKFKIFCGLYDETFPEMITQSPSFDICFIDGNHRYAPTLHYFNELKKICDKVTVYVFDDIYWNNEMIKVWNEIKKDPSVNFAVDLFKLGIVIIDQNEINRKTDFNFYITNI